MSDLVLDERAIAIRPFRVLKNGQGREYSATWFPKNPRGGLIRFLRQASVTGVRPSDHDGPCESHYAVLDIIDENEDIIQDFCVPTASSWRWVKRKLGSVVVSQDGKHQVGESE